MVRLSGGAIGGNECAEKAAAQVAGVAAVEHAMVLKAHFIYFMVYRCMQLGAQTNLFSFRP